MVVGEVSSLVSDNPQVEVLLMTGVSLTLMLTCCIVSVIRLALTSSPPPIRETLSL